MAQAKKIISLTKEQFNTLVANGSITANGVTIEFNENDIYLTPQPSYYEQVDGVVMPSQAGTLATQEWTSEQIAANGGKLYRHVLSGSITSWENYDNGTGQFSAAIDFDFSIINSSSAEITVGTFNFDDRVPCLFKIDDPSDKAGMYFGRLVGISYSEVSTLEGFMYRVTDGAIIGFSGYVNSVEDYVAEL